MLSKEMMQRLYAISKRGQTASHAPNCGCHECVLVSNVKVIAKAVHDLAASTGDTK